MSNQRFRSNNEHNLAEQYLNHKDEFVDWMGKLMDRGRTNGARDDPDTGVREK